MEKPMVPTYISVLCDLPNVRLEELSLSTDLSVSGGSWNDVFELIIAQLQGLLPVDPKERLVELLEYNFHEQSYHEYLRVVGSIEELVSYLNLTEHTLVGIGYIWGGVILEYVRNHASQ